MASETGARAGGRHRWPVAALLLALAGPARGDGVAFDGDLPAEPHLLLDLDRAQQRAADRADAAGVAGRLPEIALTPEQRRLLREQTGAEVRWVFAARREWLAGECSCGAYNLGVRVGKAQLAVLRRGLGDHLAPSEVGRIARALVDPALRAEPGAAPELGLQPGLAASPEELPPAARALAARFPPGEPGRRLALAGGWKAQKVRLAALPSSALDGRLGWPLRTLSAVRTRARATPYAEWPALGARLDEGDRVLLVVPGLAAGELGPAVPSWVLLAYEKGRLQAAVERTGAGWSATRYDWGAGAVR